MNECVFLFFIRDIHVYYLHHYECVSPFVSTYFDPNLIWKVE